MKIGIAFLRLRMRLNLDPGARAANRRLAMFERKLEQDRIRAKAMNFQSTPTDEIIAQPVVDNDHVVSVFEMPRAEKPQPVPYSLDSTGIDVVFDPTDPATVELMRRHEMGSVAHRDKEATFQNQVDATPPKDVDFEFEWDGPTDPFAGIKNLG